MGDATGRGADVVNLSVASNGEFPHGDIYWSKLAGKADDRLQITLDFLSFYLTTPGGIAFWSHPQSNNLTANFRLVLELHEVAIDHLDISSSEDLVNK